MRKHSVSIAWGFGAHKHQSTPQAILQVALVAANIFMHKFSEEAGFYNYTEYNLVLILQSIFKGYSPILMSLNGGVEIDLEVRQLHYEKSQLPGSKQSQRKSFIQDTTVYLCVTMLIKSAQMNIQEFKVIIIIMGRC